MSFTLPEFVKDAGERAIKAFAGAVLSTLGLGVVDILHTNWEAALSVGGGAALVSVLMSLGSLTIANTMSPASVVPTAPVVPPVTPALAKVDTSIALNAQSFSDVRAQIADLRDQLDANRAAHATLAPIPVAAQLPPGPQVTLTDHTGVTLGDPDVSPLPTGSFAPATLPKPAAENFTPDVARVATARTKRAFVTPKSPVVAPIAAATKPVPEALAAAWKLDAATTGT